MAPKKNVASKAKDSKAAAVVDVLSPKKMSKEQLERHVERLQKELDQEREKHSYFQVEHEKSHSLWEVACQQLEGKAAELRNKVREMEEAAQLHQVEIKAYKDKMKHLMKEHQDNLTDLKAESTLSMKRVQEDHRAQEMGLRKHTCTLQKKLRDQELAHEQMIKSMRLKQEKEITRLRKDFERQLKEVEARYTEKMETVLKELDSHRQAEMSEVKDSKTEQINELMKNHEKAFSDLRNYYEDMNSQNTRRICLLKEWMEEKKMREKCWKKEKAALLLENKELKEKLNQAQEQTSKLQKKLSLYNRNREALKNAQAHLKTAQQEVKDYQWEQEVLVRRFSKVQAERDDLYENFMKSINEVQKKASFKSLLLERKLSGLHSILKRKEAELSEVLAASNLDPRASSLVSQKLESVLSSKDTTIKELQFQLMQSSKAQNDILNSFKTKLMTCGVPVDNLDLKPQESSEMGQGPEGLTSVPCCCQKTPRVQLLQAESWALPPLGSVPLKRPQ